MYNAIMVAFAVFFGVAGHELFGMAMFSRPIVVAPLTGLLLGDIQTGLLVGASLEAIFMGVVNIGISSTAEPALAAGLATAFAIELGGNIDSIIPLVFPLAVIGLQIMNMIFSFVSGPMANKFFELSKKYDTKSYSIHHYVVWFVHYALYALIPFFAVLFGVDVVKGVLDGIPEVIMNGLTVAGNLLPAVGMAMLMRMLWDKEVMIWYFFGAVIMAYFELPLVAIAALGLIIAVVIAQREIQMNKNKQSNVAYAGQADTNVIDGIQEEEDFFNGN